MRESGRHPFRWLWTAVASGALGDGITLAVLPLLMASLTREPTHVALIQTVAALPWLLFGLHASALVDRWDKATALVVADVCRAVLAGMLAVIVSLGLSQVSLLLLFAFGSSVATVIFRAANAAVLPALVSNEDLARANGRLQAGQTVAGSFVGPGLGGVLFSLAHWAPPATQALAFAVSAACLRQLPRRTRTRPRSNASLRGDIAEGLRQIWSDRTLRALAGATIFQGAGIWMLMAVLVLYSLQILQAPPVGYGALITAYAAGGLIGALLCSRLEGRVGARTSLTSAALLGGLGILGLAATHTFTIGGSCMLALGIATMILSVIGVTIRQKLTPRDLLGRVSSTSNVLNVASAPIVAPISGLIGTHLGIQTAMVVAGCVFLAAAPVLIAGVRQQ